MAEHTGGYETYGSTLAPLANIVLSHPETGVKQKDVLMLIDSGASTTVLPPWATQQIGLIAESDRALEVESFDGTQSARPIVRAKIHMGNIVFRIECILHDEGEQVGIIGRDILNMLYLTLAGPEKAWRLASSR